MYSTESREEPESIWDELAPVIDEALASLSAKDRDAILLRFFEKKSYRDIGEAFGGNENSARLRVVRALEKLRGFFHMRGIVVSAGLLSSSLFAQPLAAAPPALVNSVMGVIASSGSSAAVTVFVRKILRRTRWRRWPVWAGSMAVALLLVGAVTALSQRERVRDRVQTAALARTTALAIDNAISFGDTDAFIARVHFRNAEEEQFKPVLAAFIRAAVSLRNQVRESFDAQPVRQRIWFWAAGQLLNGQPRRGDTLPAGLVTDDFFQPYLMVMVKDGGAWKWDYFASLPPDVAKERMKVLKEKAVLCERVTRQIQEGEIRTAEEVLPLIQQGSSRASVAD